MTTKVKVYRYTGNTEYAEMLALLNSDGDELPIGALQFATSVSADGAADTLSHVTPTAGLPVQQQTGATWAVSGTVTAELSATDNAVLDAIAARLETTLAVQGDKSMPSDGGLGYPSLLPAISHQMVYTGTTWHRMRGDSADGILVNLGANNDVTVAGVSTLAEQQTQTTHLTTLIGHVDGVESSLADAVTALQIIDDWDETNRAKVNLVVGQAGITAGAGAVGASTPRVTLASDDPGVALLTTIDTDTGAIATAAASIQAAVETLDNIVSGSEAQVDIVASLPAGANAIGKLAANSGVDIGDVDVTSLPGELRGPGSPAIDSYTSAAVSAAANTANQELIAAPGASKQIWVYGFVGIADTGAGSVSLQDEDDTALSGVMPVAENGGFAISPNGNFAMPWLKVPTNKALEIDTVTCGFKGAISYAIVSV